ncbi:hypothetical protein [Streptomyces sp. VRA16 Mangrove soil]|uniref:hypothetical protein n=1 Tax=Streptomyces sp. VRA16 Mangrove soil TaxID=2817434 RepID=UPI001E56C851|nr:hypothetical protein [Streptomyces sp. VRA16 Mangrove soil]
MTSGAAHGQWLTRGRDGRLSLYAPTEGGLLRWTETAAGGPSWNGPHFVAVAGLTHLRVVQGADSYVHFLGRRKRTDANGVVGVDIVHAIQYQTGLAFTDWRSLGNPHKDRNQGAHVAPPSGAVAKDGTVYVFVRGAHGGLMMRREGAGGKWQPWQDLQGMGLDPRPAPVALDDGRIEVVAAAETGVFVWGQTQAGGDFAQPRGFALRPAPGTVTALETFPGRPTFFWTDAVGGAPAAWRAGGWPLPLTGAAADGGYAALRATVDGYECVVLACRDRAGDAVVGLGGLENEANGFWWYPLEQPCLGTPALSLDGRGRVVVALIGPDGAPLVARQQGAGLSLSGWQRL